MAENWQARCDAQTLADSKVIKEDPKRIAAAKIVAPAMAEEQQDRADALKSVTTEKKPDRAKKPRKRVSKVNKLTGM